jgi:hypothetical protein
MVLCELFDGIYFCKLLASWLFQLKLTSGCPWPKATVKSPVGACNLWPLFLIFYCPGRPALPCPAPTLPCPALPRPALFRIFLLLPGTGGGSYTGNFFSFCCQGQEEEVTPCPARQTDRQTCSFHI